MLNDSFNALEVLEMAAEIEKKGLDFYKKYAEKTDDLALKNLFLKLAGEEQQHYDTIMEITGRVRDNKDEMKEFDYIYEPEVSAYLHTLVEFSIFPPETEQDNSFNADNVEKILLLAMMAEKESILLYQEMAKYNKGETGRVLQRLVEEEKQHLIDLKEIR